MGHKVPGRGRETAGRRGLPRPPAALPIPGILALVSPIQYTLSFGGNGSTVMGLMRTGL